MKEDLALKESRTSCVDLARVVVVFAFIFSAVPPISANDTMVTLEAGGLVPLKSANIVMESEKLQISIHRVNVDYLFRNTSGHDVNAVVAFPLPEIDGGLIEHSPIELPSKDPVNFMLFKVAVDGKPISPKLEMKAFKDGKDITARLRGLGLPVSVLDPGLKSAFESLPTAQREQLERDELVVRDVFEQAGKTVERLWAYWDVRIQYYWEQHFPAKSTVRISHSYLPVVGGSYIPFGDDGKFIVNQYCGSSPTLSKIKTVKSQLTEKPDNSIALYERNIKYILTTANNWSGPIRHFHLEVRSDDPQDVFLTRWPSMKQVSPTHYELSLSNFRPDRDLDLMILQAKR